MGLKPSTFTNKVAWRKGVLTSKFIATLTTVVGSSVGKYFFLGLRKGHEFDANDVLKIFKCIIYFSLYKYLKLTTSNKNALSKLLCIKTPSSTSFALSIIT